MKLKTHAKAEIHKKKVCRRNVDDSHTSRLLAAAFILLQVSEACGS